MIERERMMGDDEMNEFETFVLVSNTGNVYEVTIDTNTYLHLSIC